VWQPAVDDAETSNLVRPHWHYEYDSNGNETMQRDPKGHETTFAYDADNRRISRTLPDLAQETWKYDTFGRLSVHTDFKGQSTRYLYEIDPQFGGRLTGEERFTGLPDGTPDERTDYSYDNLGRQKTVTEYAQLDSDPDLDISRAATTYQYDPITGGVAQVSSPEGTINHTYDAATGLLTRTYTDNNDTSYLYDVRGRLWQMHVTKLNGQSVSQTTTYTYDAVGNLDRVSNDNGTPTDTSDDLVHDYDYDALNRLDLLTVSRGADTIFTQDYELQSDGQRDYVVEHRYTSPTQFSETKIDWSYDALGRLIGERRDEGNDSPTSPNGDHDYLMTFAYDLAGNRKTEEIDKMGTANETVIYTYDEGDHLLNENSTVDANDAEYHYDRNGSMIDKTAASTTTTYGWDLRNRMTSATTADASTIYDYDERGQRVSQQTGTNPTTYYLNDWQNLNGHPQVLEEKQGTSAATAMLSRSYVVGIRVEGEADATNARQFILDGHGSNRGLIDSDGNVLERYDYQAFGNVARFESIDPATGTVTEIGANQATTIHLFGGDSEYDAASKFSYHDTRWRDDFHFISLDTFEGDPSSPIQLHKYLYGNANPVYYTDPTGYFSFGSLLSTIGMIARVGTGIGFGVSGAWNLANAGINLQKAYAASTSGSPSASLEIIGRMVLTIVQTYTGIFNIRLANALLFGAPSPVPLPPNGLGLLRVAVAGGGESPMAVGALVYALSPAIAVGIVNAAGVFLAANTFFSTSFGSGGSSNLPDHLLGNNPKPAPGQPTNTDLPGGEVAARKLFDDLADGPTETTPDGILRSLKNKVQLRLAKDGRWRVDIPANGSKPPETIHFNP
jgi:YD repeat-containing protein